MVHIPLKYFAAKSTKKISSFVIQEEFRNEVIRMLKEKYPNPINNFYTIEEVEYRISIYFESSSDNYSQIIQFLLKDKMYIEKFCELFKILQIENKELIASSFYQFCVESEANNYYDPELYRDKKEDTEDMDLETSNFTMVPKGEQLDLILGKMDKRVSDILNANKFCHYCGKSKVHYYTKQTRSADEPETTFFKCGDCNRSWKIG